MSWEAYHRLSATLELDHYLPATLEAYQRLSAALEATTRLIRFRRCLDDLLSRQAQAVYTQQSVFKRIRQDKRFVKTSSSRLCHQIRSINIVKKCLKRNELLLNRIATSYLVHLQD